MQIKFFNPSLGYKKIRKEMLKEIDRVLLKGDLILRGDLEKFEKKLAKFVGTKYAVGVANGTDALFLILKTLGIKQGDEVLVPNYTFIATYEAVKNNGADLKFIDVNEDLLLDENKIEEAITEKTKAIIPVHIAGKVCNMDKIIEIAGKYNLFVVEDSCQALGAKGIGIGMAMAFSFYPAKILGCYGDGGAVCTNNEELANKIRLLRNHCQGEDFGFNSRLDNLQAAILLIKMKYLKQNIRRRKEIAKKYLKELKTIKDLKLPSNRDIWQDFIIQTSNRDALKDFLFQQGIETLVGKYAVFKSLEIKELRLPCNSELINKEVDYVIKKIKEFFIDNSLRKEG